MANNLYLLFNFNNYFNRKLIRYNTLAEYLTAVGSNNYYLQSNVSNFTPNDSISTQHVFNLSTYPLENKSPDYMLVVDDNNAILQRWFVIDGKRNRAGQYTYDLYRDTIAESWNSIQGAPIFVEKAILPSTDPMIFNSENMTYNQIKDSETLLKDSTGCAWIVGYMTEDNVSRPNQESLIDKAPDYVYSSLAEYPFYKYSNYGSESCPTQLAATGNRFYISMVKSGTTVSGERQFYFDGTYGTYGTWSDTTYQTNSSLKEGNDSQENIFGYYVNEHAETIKTAINAELQIQGNDIDNEIGKIIQVNTANSIKYYEVRTDTTTYSTTAKTSVKEDTDVFSAFNSVVEAADSLYNLFTNSSYANSSSFKYVANVVSKKISIVEVQPARYTYSISNTRRRLSDQPYSMFCMPYGTTTILNFNGTGTRDWSSISLKIAKSISSTFGGSSPVLYDLQLLPYCPVRDLMNAQGKIDLDQGTVNLDYDYIKSSSSNMGIIFWSTLSKYSFDINQSISVTNYKIDNETKMYRLCSPNFAGQFEFSAAKNGGVSKFVVDFTYKPYNPYIHVNPYFGRLYGSNFGDARGLVCGGKFDLPQTSDAWATYERTNSNYDNIFNRKIENLEIQNKYSKMTDFASAITGTIQGAGTGVALGSAGGVGGMIAGGIAGGAASAIGGSLDIGINEKLRQENMSLTKDLYGYQLGTIQAMPESLVSVGSLTNNNKLFPFVETYKCTEEEEDALVEKIKWNGMTVGRIGTISAYKDTTWENTTFFKGQLIQANISNEDWHYVNTLKNELNMGIYINYEED